VLENLRTSNRPVQGFLYLYVVTINSDTFSHKPELTSVAKYVKCFIPIIFNSAINFYFDNNISPKCGPGSSVGIATDYGLDGQGSNPGGDEIFRPSRPPLGPTQPPLKWVPGLSRG